MTKMEKTIMPFRFLSQNKQAQISRSSVLIPWLTLVIGIVATLAFVRGRFRSEARSSLNDAVNTTKDYSRSVDLELLNSALRLQFFHEYIGYAPLSVDTQHHVIEDILKTTVFQRVSIFHMKKSRDLDGLPILRKISQYSLVTDSLPTSDFDFMRSVFIRKKIARMEESKLQSAFAINHSALADTINLIWRSQLKKGQFIVFSTSASSVFSHWPKISGLTAELNDPEVDLSLRFDERSKIQEGAARWSLRDSAKVVELSKENFVSADSPIRVTWTVKQSSLDPTTSLAILCFGFATTLILALFLRFVLDQNRRIANLVVSRTQDLEVAMSEAQEANSAKTRFLANMSHELRTPLNLILGMLELLEENVKDGKSGEYIRSMRVAGDHLLTLITDLLSMSREEPKEIEIKKIPINSIVFFEEIGRIIGPDCRKKGLEFFLNVTPDFPQTLLGDPGRLRQILINLLRNSLKYTAKGFISFKADVISENSKSLVRFQVADSGIGIPKGKIQRVFDRFFQIEGSKILSEGGVGLGLSIVKELALKMSGQVSVESNLGEGSVFTFKMGLESANQETWLQSFQWATSPSASLTVLKVAVLSKHRAFYERIRNLCPVDKVQVVFADPSADLSQPMDRWILDDIELARQWIGKNSSHEKSLILIADELTPLPPDLSVKRLRTVDNCPLLPSHFLASLGLQGPKKTSAPTPGSATSSQTDGSLTSASLIQSLLLEKQKFPQRILVVDDDAGNRELFGAYFNGLSCEVTFANDGREGLEIFKSSQPNLVIADLRMPGMDGFELSDAISQLMKSQNREPVPVILVTADALEETSTEAKKHAVSILLTKPLRKSNLLAAIARIFAEEKNNLVQAPSARLD